MSRIRPIDDDVAIAEANLCGNTGVAPLLPLRGTGDKPPFLRIPASICFDRPSPLANLSF
jgi:hypothetical protein